LGLLVDHEPIRVDVLDKDPRTGEENWYWATIREFSEEDVSRRTKVMQAPVSNEESRRGRSRRGRDQVHVERIRVFNFENAVEDWNFTYPETYYDRDQGRRIKHPKAGQVMPRNRETFFQIPERIMTQLQDEINAINEPPETPEIRDEDGEVTQEAEDSPTELNSDDKSEQHSVA